MGSSVAVEEDLCERRVKVSLKEVLQSQGIRNRAKLDFGTASLVGGYSRGYCECGSETAGPV